MWVGNGLDLGFPGLWIWHIVFTPLRVGDVGFKGLDRLVTAFPCSPYILGVPYHNYSIISIIYPKPFSKC